MLEDGVRNNWFSKGFKVLYKMEERNLRKICIGVVVSNKMDKIISVFV